MSMRMCSLSRSVHDAHRRNTALNNTHCNSSQEFDDMSNTLRTVALTADTTTAARMAHATHLPICVLMASITPLSLRSVRTLFPFPSAPGVSEHDQRTLNGVWRRPIGAASLAVAMAATLASIMGIRSSRRRPKLANFPQELERAKGIEPSTYSLGSCRSTTELRPRFDQHSEGQPRAARSKQSGADESVAAELLAQFALGALQGFTPAGRQIFAGAIDVEGQHRKRRTVRIGFALAAAFRRAFERGGDLLWIAAGKNPMLKIERIA